jgi:hydroxymethylpyrimidine/phosphomethylpyrimidine kinase
MQDGRYWRTLRKIGMLHAPEIVQTVADAIDRHGMYQVVPT